MRGRISELEALLAALQQEMENKEENYARDLNELHRRLQEQRIHNMKSRTLAKCHSCEF